MRGEHAGMKIPPIPAVGSPPRAWGTRVVQFEVQPPNRITPTCVGNTMRSAFHRCRLSDHPHVRGEHCPSSKNSISHSGSPPRAWGTHYLRMLFVPSFRITPTCVGNTKLRCAADACNRDHPHVRGEHIPALAAWRTC